MTFSIVTIDSFENELKHLAKKYPSLSNDLAKLVESLTVQPIQGAHIGDNCYKIRLAITSKGKGKSGGARIITYVYVSGKTVYLLAIYDKSEAENIRDKEIQDRLKKLKDLM